MRVLQRAWLEAELSWVELGGAGWSWVELGGVGWSWVVVGAGFSNTRYFSSYYMGY